MFRTTLVRGAAFHDIDAYEKLLEASQSIDWRTYVIALLGGKDGLRVGEIVALEWSDIDLERRQISACRCALPSATGINFQAVAHDAGTRH